MNKLRAHQQNMQVNTTPVKQVERGYFEDFKKAENIFSLAKKYNTPLTPKSFAVWFSYVAGDNKLVNRRIDKLIKSSDTIDSYQMELAHDEFICDFEAKSKQQTSVGENLETEMAEIVNLVQLHLSASDNYTGSLRQTVDTLSSEVHPTKILKSVKILIDESTKMQFESASLHSSLQQSEAQVRKMRSSLAKSRKNEMIDHLTGLSNRRRFDLSLAAEIETAQTRSIPMCLAMIDIDHFKKLNDTFGHAIGDQVIKFFASLLKKSVKGRDTTARYGGEEFSIILPSTSVGDARILIEGIRSQLADTNLVLKKNKVAIGKVTASFGIAQIRECDSPNDITERADANLYKAKNAGRNCTVSSE